MMGWNYTKQNIIIFRMRYFVSERVGVEYFLSSTLKTAASFIFATGI